MEELVRQKIANNVDARGLAVIIINDYMNSAVKDAMAIKETFKHLNFAVITRINATKAEIKALIASVASYLHYPKTYNCFAVVLSGHGNGNSMILSAHDEKVHLNKDIFQLLDSATLKGIPKLILIDACRVEGDEDDLLLVDEGHSLSLPKDFLIGYSPRYGHMSTEGSLWMQILAAKLKTMANSVQTVLKYVNREVHQSGAAVHQLGAEVIDSTSDNIILYLAIG